MRAAEHYKQYLGAACGIANGNSAMISVSNKLKGLRADDCGSILVEFAVSLSFLTILMLGVVELSGHIWQAIELNNAAEAGLMYATRNGWCVGPSCSPNTGSQISSAEVNAGVANVTANPSPSCYYGCPSSSLPYTISVQTGSCGIDVPPTCSDGYAARQYVTFGAKLNRTSFITRGTGLLNLSLPATISETVVVRIK